MVVEHSNGSPLSVGMCTLVIRSEDDRGYQILHMLQPVEKMVSYRAALAPDSAESAAPGGMAARGSDESEGGLFPMAGQLTSREKEVLHLLKDGVPTKTIAERLEISVTTVRNHIQGILRKLGAHSRLEAVSIARKGGII
jgi:DNA-binding NarL/FixJ family response regulator